ncbi:hypothetical protein KJ766_00320 [Patescibacteria group bacterium]|nr:hypothetical protein [Patescibacteria group bacterium]MBU1718900.1 hypothetical protein [Bacteroidota bacterium]
MKKPLYTLKKKSQTGELHLFEAEEVSKNSCLPNEWSLCKKMNKNSSVENTFLCQTEDSARVLCAETGRKVCGICISHLYETY